MNNFYYILYHNFTVDFYAIEAEVNTSQEAWIIFTVFDFYILKLKSIHIWSPQLIAYIKKFTAEFRVISVCDKCLTETNHFGHFVISIPFWKKEHSFYKVDFQFAIMVGRKDVTFRVFTRKNVTSLYNSS